jgi:hypothetical protein
MALSIQIVTTSMVCILIPNKKFSIPTLISRFDPEYVKRLFIGIASTYVQNRACSPCYRGYARKVCSGIVLAYIEKFNIYFLLGWVNAKISFGIRFMRFWLVFHNFRIKIVGWDLHIQTALTIYMEIRAQLVPQTTLLSGGFW